MKYFNNEKTAEEIKKTYRALLKKNHPDLGGSKEIAQEIIAEMELAMTKIFRNIKIESESNVDFDAEMFGDVLKEVVNFEELKIEIIGHWIYAFNSFKYKEQLKELGFWFSGKHKAWVFSGQPKRKIRTKFSTDDNRERLGSKVVATKRTYQLQ